MGENTTVGVPCSDSTSQEDTGGLVEVETANGSVYLDHGEVLELKQDGQVYAIIRVSDE